MYKEHVTQRFSVYASSYATILGKINSGVICNLFFDSSVTYKIVFPQIIIVLVFVLFSCTVIAENEKVLRVGPRSEFMLPSLAAHHANDGDIIEIDAAGDYSGDEVVWTRNDLTIRGINGRPKLQARGNIKNGKAIWVIKGKNIVIENLEFSNATVREHNGAGIRIATNGNLTIRHCYFHDNENGILGGRKKTNLTIEYSEFARNGYGDGKTHNVYIGKIHSLTFRFNYSHHANVGHNLKSRAAENFILYNRIMDEDTGTSSYIVDIPNGGFAVLMGNLLQQGPQTQNWTIVSYGAEGLRNEKNELYLINNSIVNGRDSGLFVKLKEESKAFAYNNIFAGQGQLSKLPLTEKNNLRVDDLKTFVNPADFDYHLRVSSDAIDAGTVVSSVEGFLLVPDAEYHHPSGKSERRIVNQIDIGAYEFHP